jgi:hypothetical protein
MLYINETKYHSLDREVEVDCNGHFPPNSDYIEKSVSGEFFYVGKFVNDSIYIHNLSRSPGGFVHEYQFKGKKNKN